MAASATEVTYQQQWESNQTWRNISGGQMQQFATNKTENRTQQMMAEEGGELHLEPFVHIQREEEDGEGAESHNTTTSNEDRIQVLDEGNSSVQAHPETKTGEGELSQGANVIQASKTIDEALNEIDDSYVKHQQSKENETKDQPEPTTQNETVIRENHSELNKVTQNHSDARMPSENQNPNPWVDHSHEAVNRTVSLMKEKNKKLKLEEPALDRVKREGIPIFLESKGGPGSLELQRIGSGSGSAAFSILTGAMFSALLALPLLLVLAGLTFLYRWHLRAEAKKRLSVDTELAAPFLTQIVVENDYGGKVAVPLAHQLGYITCYANNNNGPRKRSLEKEDKYH